MILHQISIDDIISLLRADGHIKRLLEYLFETIHYVDKGRMPVCILICRRTNYLIMFQVYEFIKTLSVLSRGSKAEKLGCKFIFYCNTKC